MKTYINTCSFVVAIIILIIGACSPVLLPLKRQYAVGPLEITSAKSTDSVWSNIVDLFTRNDLPIKTIDKKKGVLTSGKTSFIAAYSFEDESGQLQEPKAWVVLPKAIANKKEWKPKAISGKWSIQVVKSAKGTITIKVDPIVVCTYWPNTFTSAECRGQSTGRLEELIKRSLAE